MTISREFPILHTKTWKRMPWRHFPEGSRFISWRHVTYLVSTLKSSNFKSSREKFQSSSSTLISIEMSYSNASTGGKPADPYKEENIDEPSLKAKIEGLLGFIKSSKFGMLTTRDKSTGLLASRCMAVTAQVCLPTIPIPLSPMNSSPPAHEMIFQVQLTNSKPQW